MTEQHDYNVRSAYIPKGSRPRTELGNETKRIKKRLGLSDDLVQETCVEKDF